MGILRSIARGKWLIVLLAGIVMCWDVKSLVAAPAKAPAVIQSETKKNVAPRKKAKLTKAQHKIMQKKLNEIRPDIIKAVKGLLALREVWLAGIIMVEENAQKAANPSYSDGPMRTSLLKLEKMIDNLIKLLPARDVKKHAKISEFSHRQP